MQFVEENSVLALEPDEKIIYQAEKIGSNLRKHYRMIIYTAILLYLLRFIPDLNQYIYIATLSMLITIIIIHLKLSYDFCCVNIYLTNKSVIIKNIFKTHIIPFSEIKRLNKSSNIGGDTCSQITISTHAGKNFCYCFFDSKKLKQRFSELYPNFSEEKTTQKSKSQIMFLIIIFLATYNITMLVFKFFIKFIFPNNPAIWWGFWK